MFQEMIKPLLECFLCHPTGYLSRSRTPRRTILEKSVSEVDSGKHVKWWDRCSACINCVAHSYRISRSALVTADTCLSPLVAITCSSTWTVVTPVSSQFHISWVQRVIVLWSHIQTPVMLLHPPPGRGPPLGGGCIIISFFNVCCDTSNEEVP